MQGFAAKYYLSLDRVWRFCRRTRRARPCRAEAQQVPLQHNFVKQPESRCGQKVEEEDKRREVEMLPPQQREDCIQKRRAEAMTWLFLLDARCTIGGLVKVGLGDFSLGVGFLYISQTILNYIYGLKGISGNCRSLPHFFFWMQNS